VPLNILLADDSVPAQNMGKKILVDAGYNVLTVSNGLEALRRIADAKPDVAILDIFMPGYTGLEICERLRADPATATLPVILTVGKLEPYRPSDGESVRSNAVIVKPFAAAELVSAVHSLIGAPSAAQVPPEPVGQVPAMEPGIDAPRENQTAAEVQERPAPPAVAPPAPPELPAEGLREEAPDEPPDEPLFSYGESPAPVNAEPLAPPERSVYAADPLPAGDEPGEPESLILNPDAGHTPFSASTADLVSPASQFAAPDDESPFSEFDLEVDASNYAAGPNPDFAAAEKATLPLPDAAGQVRFISDAEPPEAELSAIGLGPAEAAEEAASAAAATLEMESPELEIPMELLLEVQEADAPSSAAATSQDAGQASEEILMEVAAVDEEPGGPASAAQTVEDEDARRLAFEALFNSTEPIPLEKDFAAPPAELPMDTLPSIANVSRDQTGDIAQDAELETASNDDQPGFIALEPDPYLLEEEQPLSVVGKIPDRDPLLEDGLASNWPPEQAAVPQEALTSVSGEVYAPRPEEGSVLTAALPVEVIEVEAPQRFAEPHAEAVEVPAAEAAESAQVVPEAVPEAVQAAVEVIEVEAPQPAAEARTEAVEVPPVAEAVESPRVVPEAVPETVQAVVEVIEVEAPQPFAEAHAEAVQAAVEVIEVEAPQPAAEPEAEVLEVPAAPATESAQMVPEAEAEVAKAAVEVIEVEAPQRFAVPQAEAREVPAAPVTESAQMVPEAEAEVAEAAAEAAPEAVQVEPQPEPTQASEAPQLAPAEAAHPEPAAKVEAISSSPEVPARPSEVERIHRAVERVIDRFKPVLVAAIVRELARHD
jgi:CheY-like chemotaxis protein